MQITSEKDVIALAGWPMLNQLVLFGNPLIATTSGDPPLLGRLFKQRLSIQLVRYVYECFKLSSTVFKLFTITLAKFIFSNHNFITY